jgi:hypothetical protein
MNTYEVTYSRDGIVTTKTVEADRWDYDESFVYFNQWVETDDTLDSDIVFAVSRRVFISVEQKT